MDDELAFAGPAGGRGGVGNVPCAVCGNRTAMCCSACEAVFYCSPACQQRDWKDHWRVCGTLTAPGGGTGSPGAGGGVVATMQQKRPRSPRSASPDRRAIENDASGYEVALPVSNFAHAAAAQASATMAARDRRLRLRVSAVLAAKENRHQDALQHAAEAYEVAQRLGTLYAEGKSMEDEGGVAELEGPALVELLIIVRAALAINDFGTGLGFLEMLCATVDRLAGVGGNPSILQPSEAATLLLTTSELCALYNHEDRAEDYSHAYLGVARLAHGEGSKEVGDAHSFLCALFSRRRRYEEAILHASSTLKIRQRHASYGAEKPVADAYWNLAVLQYQLGQHRAALDSLEAAREIHVRLSGEGVASSDVDVALGQIWTTLGEASKAMRSYRSAVRWRQRTLGFAHAETRRAAGLLAAAEIEASAEEEWRRDVEAEADEDGAAPVPRPRPRQRPRDDGEQEPPPFSPGRAVSPPRTMVAQPRRVQGEPTHQAAPPQSTLSTPMSPGDRLRSPAPGENLRSPGEAPDQAFDLAQPDQAFTLGDPREPGEGLYKGSRASPSQRLGGQTAPPAKSLPAGAFECTAGADVKALGLTPSSAPNGKDPIYVKSVDAGSWADKAGFKVGMQLISMNGVETQSMQIDDFKVVMKDRPLKIVAGPGNGPVTTSGLAPSKKPANPAAAQAPASPKASAAAPSEGKPVGKQTGLSEYTVLADVKSLGCHFTPAPMHVKGAEPGSWAEKAGIGTGWKLVTVNGKNPDTLSRDALKEEMIKRPLQLAFDPTTKLQPGTQLAPPQAQAGQAKTSPRDGAKLAPPQAQTGQAKTSPREDSKTPPKPEASNTAPANIPKPAPAAKAPVAKAEASPPPSSRPEPESPAPPPKPKPQHIPKATSPPVPTDMKREKLIKSLFQELDQKKRGRLKSREMYEIAKLMGFADPFDSDKWEEEYDGVCQDYEQDPEQGMDYDAFEDCLEEEESDYHCGDEDLAKFLAALQKKRKS